MKRIILGSFLFITSVINAQIKFEKGYIITHNGDKQDVLIRNIEWVNSPESFVYKINKNSSELTGNVTNTEGFGIYGHDSYINYNGTIDTSSTDLTSLSSKKEPELKKVHVFLKQLVTGERNLYSYRDYTILNYFYSNNNHDIKLLVYKKYHPQGNDMLVATNEGYKEQLNVIFSDTETTKKEVTVTKYNDNDLKKIFGGNQQADNSTMSHNNIKAKNRQKFNLNIRPGINFYAPLSLNGTNFTNTEFDSRSSFRVGIEAELFLPINKNKWSVIFEPSYSIYSNKKLKNTSTDIYEFSMDAYSFINLSLGLRHHMYVNDKSKIFLNAAMNIMTINVGTAKHFDFSYDGRSFYQASLISAKPFNSFVLGAGYTYNNKYTLELRYNTAAEMLKLAEIENAKLKYFSVILGYNIF